MSHRLNRLTTSAHLHEARGRPANRSRLRLPRVSSLLAATVIIGGGSLVCLMGVDGTYAFLTDSAQSSGGTVNAGSMSLSVGTAGAEGSSYTIPSTAWLGLLPGDSARQQVSVKVDNDPLRVSSAMTVRVDSALPAGFELRAQKGSCPAVALTGGALSTTDVAVGTWTSSEASSICVEVKLRADAPSSAQGTDLGPLSLIVTAKQD